MFITFEGPDGSGKTSQVAPLAQHLQKEGYSVLITREPGGTQIGDQVRTVLFDLENVAMHPRTETLLFLASRAQLVEEVIRPHLQKDGIVLSDRFADSTLAYQGFGHGNNLEQLRCLLEFATGALSPDLTLLFDVEVETGLRRREKGGDWNRLDAYDLAFHQRVRAGYHRLAAEKPDRWITINAEQPPELVQAAVRNVVMERLGVKRKT
ncbi:MAG TPA: dTMP kinase [Anaerolineales bacterium]|jgi:dTMP kinase